MSPDQFFAGGTRAAPHFRPGPADIRGDIHLQQRYFGYESAQGPVFGKTLNVMFTIDRPARDVWPVFKDFNLWQNAYGHYYSGVLGDIEGQTIRQSSAPNESDPSKYRLIKVEKAIAEQLLVLRDETPNRDVFVFMLNEHGGRTILACLLQHSSTARDADEFGKVYRQWREIAVESQRKWRDVFIPALKDLIHRSTP